MPHCPLPLPLLEPPCFVEVSFCALPTQHQEGVHAVWEVASLLPPPPSLTSLRVHVFVPVQHKEDIHAVREVASYLAAQVRPLFSPYILLR